jgi:hypothetical protein
MGDVVQFPQPQGGPRVDLIGEAIQAYRRFCKREYGFMVQAPKADRSVCRQLDDRRWLISLQDDSHGLADYEWDGARMIRVA